MITIKNKNRKFLLLGILTFIAGIIFCFKLLIKQQEPVLTETQPKDQQENVEVNSKIVLTFDKKINLNNWQIIPNPNFDFELNNIDNRLEVIPSKNLLGGTEYKIEIKNHVDSSKYYLFSFTTAPIEIDAGKIKAGVNFYQNYDKFIKENYPLINFTPHQTPKWSIYYVGLLKLEVLLKSDTSQNRQEVLNWIKSKGVDPATHEIIWKVQK